MGKWPDFYRFLTSASFALLSISSLFLRRLLTKVVVSIALGAEYGGGGVGGVKGVLRKTNETSIVLGPFRSPCRLSLVRLTW